MDLLHQSSSQKTDITYQSSCVVVRTTRCRHTFLKLSAKPIDRKELRLNII